MDELLWDETGGGYFNNVAGDASILLRMKVCGSRAMALGRAVPTPAACCSPRQRGGHRQSSAPAKLPLLKRPPPGLPPNAQEDYDGAEPAASSIALANLWRLAGLCGTEVRSPGALASGQCAAAAPGALLPAASTLPPCSCAPQEAKRWRERAAQCAAAFGERLAEAPIALPQMAAALHLLTLGHPRQVHWGAAAARCDDACMCSGRASPAPFHSSLRAAPALQVIIAGPRGAPATEALVDAAFAPFAPGGGLAGPGWNMRGCGSVQGAGAEPAAPHAQLSQPDSHLQRACTHPCCAPPPPCRQGGDPAGRRRRGADGLVAGAQPGGGGDGGRDGAAGPGRPHRLCLPELYLQGARGRVGQVVRGFAS